MRSKKSPREPSVYDGIDDPDQLSWALKAYGDLGRPDREIEALQEKAAVGRGTHAQISKAVVGVPKPRRSKRQDARLARIRKFHPALAAFGPVPAPDMPGSAHEANGHEGVQARDRDPGSRPSPDALVQNNDLQAKPWAWSHEPFSPFPPLPLSSSNFAPTNGKYFILPWHAQPAETKSSTLTGVDALKAYNGLAFAMRHHGRPMNTHIIIIWAMVPGVDQNKANVLLGKYLERATKWLKVGQGPRRNFVRNPRKGEQMHYIWVHENAPGRGFHTHILTFVPPKSRLAFRQWSEQCLANFFKRPLGRDVVRHVPGYGDEVAQVRNTWRWYRYLMKQLDGNEMLRIYEEGGVPNRANLRGIIKPWRERPALPFAEKIRRVGVSHSIGESAQEKVGFKSALMTGEIADIYSGRELSDWRDERWGAEHFPNGI